MSEPAKGELTGQCGQLLCTTKPARWHHHHKGYYVCEGCAIDENIRDWMNRSDGTPCCHLNGSDPEPKPVPITGYYEDPFDNIWP